MGAEASRSLWQTGIGICSIGIMSFLAGLLLATPLTIAASITPAKWPANPPLKLPGTPGNAGILPPTEIRKATMSAHRLLPAVVGTYSLDMPRLVFRPLLRKRPQEPLGDWLARASDYVYRATENCNTTETFLGPQSGKTAMYGVIAPGAVSCGLCSQRAYWLAALLKQNGIHARLYGLTGHVVLTVPDEPSGKRWVLDPDYGIAPFLVDLSSAYEMQMTAARNYRFLEDAGHKQLYVDIVGLFSSTSDNTFSDMSYQDHLAWVQSRWIRRLWRGVMAGLREEAKSRRGRPHTAESPSLELARALHAALVAAERKYGLYGYRTQNVTLDVIDFISASLVPSAQSVEPRLKVINWSYRTARLRLATGAFGGCWLEEDTAGAIVLPPHSSLSVDVGGACVSVLPH